MPNLYIVSAPSGAGKTSLVNALIEKLAHIEISISYTTRPQRDQERPGVNYHFIDVSEFQKREQHSDFLESAEVFGNHYGTSKSWVEEKLERSDVILEIDWQGAEQIRAKMPQSISIFILPPSIETLRARLSARGQDSTEIIDQRMEKAIDECHHVKEYDYVIINDNFDHALEELKSIVIAQRLKKENRQPIIEQFA